MAEEKINPDVGVIIGSQSQSIFMEYLSLFPEAQKVYELMDSTGCPCGKESCARDRFQGMIKGVCDEDPTKTIDFLKRASKAKNFSQLADIAFSFKEPSLSDLEQKLENLGLGGLNLRMR